MAIPPSRASEPSLPRLKMLCKKGSSHQWIPLHTAHLRDPVGPQIQFASESFINEIALHRARYCMSLSVVAGCWGGCRNRRHGRPFAC
jgi:hypothetical protein